MLLEVTRKVWVGLLMRRIKDSWIGRGLLNESQHAFLEKKGCGTAIPIVMNCLETAREMRSDIFLTSWDMRRAFDSLGKK